LRATNTCVFNVDADDTLLTSCCQLLPSGKCKVDFKLKKVSKKARGSERHIVRETERERVEMEVGLAIA